MIICTVAQYTLYLSIFLGSRAYKKFNIITKIISKINVSIIHGTEKIYIYTVLEKKNGFSRSSE